MRKKGRPFLGICVGMQLMAERGREYEVTTGLGWIPGEVDRIAPADPDAEDPAHGLEHARTTRKPHPLLDGIALGRDGLHAYFVHSYHLKTSRPRRPGRRGRLWRPGHRDGRRATTMAGTQFHPEKSQRLGLALIANFLKWKP